jgi:hypothetical protein
MAALRFGRPVSGSTIARRAVRRRSRPRRTASRRRRGSSSRLSSEPTHSSGASWPSCNGPTSSTGGRSLGGSCAVHAAPQPPDSTTKTSDRTAWSSSDACCGTQPLSKIFIGMKASRCGTKKSSASLDRRSGVINEFFGFTAYDPVRAVVLPPCSDSVARPPLQGSCRVADSQTNHNDRLPESSLSTRGAAKGGLHVGHE